MLPVEVSIWNGAPEHTKLGRTRGELACLSFTGKTESHEADRRRKHTIVGVNQAYRKGDRLSKTRLMVPGQADR